MIEIAGSRGGSTDSDSPSSDNSLTSDVTGSADDCSDLESISDHEPSDSDLSDNALPASSIISLYEDSNISVQETVYRVMKLFLDNSLSKKALQGILKLMCDVLLEGHRLPQSQYICCQIH